MREIKFRAWDQRDKKMFTHESDILGFRPDRFVLQQFTGLSDKDGKEVYEGDVLNQTWPDGKTVHGFVRWDDDNARFSIRNIVSGDWTLEHLVAEIKEQDLNGYIVSLSKDVEVIGNIYENPELLKTN